MYGIARNLRLLDWPEMTAQIRLATLHNRDAVRAVHLSAFPEEERHLVASLACKLLNEQTKPQTISLVAEISGIIVGHIAFSPVSVEGNPDWLGYILAPLGVVPTAQNRGIGSMLVESGIERLARHDVNVLFVYGDPKYYGKFGFNADSAAQFLPPYELKHPFGWQALVLNKAEFSERAVRLSCVEPLRDRKLW